MLEAIFLSFSVLAALLLVSLPDWLCLTSWLRDLSRSSKSFRASWSLSGASLSLMSWTHTPRDRYERRRTEDIKKISALVEQHEVAEILESLIHKDGAGSWPPRANHTHSAWPVALQAYKDVYLQLAPLIPQAVPSLDDAANRAKIDHFRSLYRRLLRDRVQMTQVIQLLRAADAGRWDIFPREIYNAFYCCIAHSRHAYRWATIPVVKVAQLEREVDLPVELSGPWKYLQHHFGCTSESGNNMSNLVLNFDMRGAYAYRINTNMSAQIQAGEESFARIFHDVERLGVPVYHDMAQAIVNYARNDKAACLKHVASITAQIRLILGSYLDNMHDQNIARTIWLQHVQGFYAWGIGHWDEASDEWVKFDGLSGNQILLFQAVDAFLGIEQYLSPRDQERNVPARQRALCAALAKHSFRHFLSDLSNDPHEIKLVNEFRDIAKRLRFFRSAHRIRAKFYLSHPAPERLPMTAGKSVLEPSVEQSLEYLDSFMIKRFSQTV